MKKSLKQILRENMYRFGTKNLNEQAGMSTLQSASADEHSDWEGIFNNFQTWMNDNGSQSNKLFGWWLETYAAMGSKLAFYAERLKAGSSLSEFQQDILKIAAASMECIKKFQTTNSQLWAEFEDEGNDYIISDIKDDLVGELKDLLKSAPKLDSGKIAEKLRGIAHNYQMMSEQLLEISWDFSGDDSDNVNIYSQN